MKRKTQIAVVLIMLILEPWIASLTYCEILTAKFSNSDLVTVCESNNMIGSIDTLKVLEKNPWYLKVYVRNKQGGHVMLLENNKNASYEQWEVKDWWTIWAKHGSADGFIWPYIR